MKGNKTIAESLSHSHGELIKLTFLWCSRLFVFLHRAVPVSSYSKTTRLKKNIKKSRMRRRVFGFALNCLKVNCSRGARQHVLQLQICNIMINVVTVALRQLELLLLL